MDNKIASTLSGATLAYLGDAVFEVLVRRYLISLGISHGGTLSRLALGFVRATAQSEGMDKLEPILTEQEEYIFKRGRNANGIAIPKSASAREYRRATGLEALFAYLDLTGQSERADELFRIGFSDVMAELDQKINSEGATS